MHLLIIIDLLFFHCPLEIYYLIGTCFKWCSCKTVQCFLSSWHFDTFMSHSTFKPFCWRTRCFSQPQHTLIQTINFADNHGTLFSSSSSSSSSFAFSAMPTVICFNRFAWTAAVAQLWDVFLCSWYFHTSVKKDLQRLWKRKETKRIKGQNLSLVKGCSDSNSGKIDTVFGQRLFWQQQWQNWHCLWSKAILTATVVLTCRLWLLIPAGSLQAGTFNHGQAVWPVIITVSLPSNHRCGPPARSCTVFAWQWILMKNGQILLILLLWLSSGNLIMLWFIEWLIINPVLWVKLPCCWLWWWWWCYCSLPQTLPALPMCRKFSWSFPVGHYGIQCQHFVKSETRH